MSQIFLDIVNMSISASYLVLAVLLLRFLMRKAPRWITVLLWGIVGVRLVCPFSIESVLSLIPKAEVVSPDIMMDPTPAINTGIPIVNQIVNPMISDAFTPDPGTSANPLQLWIPTLALIWLVGMAALLIYTVISYAKIKRRIGTAVLLRGPVYQSENVDSPFVLGVIRPRIYLPFGMDEKDRELVVAHEMAHIRRKDHLWKPLGFLLLVLHWFNPLMWLGYVLLCRDIEFACDEKVIGELDREGRADYSRTLLTCSVNRRMLAACPLAFGEVGVRTRVRSVLSYKKPAFWIILLSLVLCVVLAVCFLTNPESGDGGPAADPNLGLTDPDSLTYEQRYLMEQYPTYFGLDASKGLDVYVCMFAPEAYYLRLYEHSDTDFPGTLDDFMTMRGLVGISVMRMILDTYDITREDVTVVPFSHPLSSYIGSYMFYPVGGSPEEAQAAFKEKILDMLFGTEQFSPPSYGSMQFDVDGDGKIEHCILGFGMTSGRFSFTFSASEVSVGEWKKEYETVIYSAWYKLSFVKCDDGVVRVQGIDEQDGVHHFDISIVDGNVHLTENGVPIGEVTAQTSGNASLVYADPTLSWVLSDVPAVVIQDGVLYEEREKSHIVGGRDSLAIYTTLGTVTEVVAEQKAFKDLGERYSGQYASLVSDILENNDRLYQVDPEDREGVSLYYVMEQKDGSTLLVYGHYENGEKTDFVRWIFGIG